MAIEPSRPPPEKPFQSNAGQEFDSVRQIKERTRAFLAKLVASSAVLITLLAAGSAILTRQYEMLSVTWNIAGPLLAGITAAYFVSGYREDLDREAILGRQPLETSAQQPSVPAKSRIEQEVRHTQPGVHGLNPFVWMAVAILIGATASIAISADQPPQSQPILLGLLLFMSLLGLAMMAFLWFDQRLRHQNLLRNARVGLERTKTLKRRSASLTQMISQRRKSQNG